MPLVLLIIHFLLCAALTGLILIQRSEGGALGMGGGPGGLMSGRGAANLLTRTTAALAAGFFLTSIVLNVVVARSGEGASVLDRVSTPTTISIPDLGPAEAPAEPAAPAPQPVIPDQE
jgi:preprotein translocase subunit SecG